MVERKTQKGLNPVDPALSNDGGLNVQGDAPTGASSAEMQAINADKLEKGDVITSKILIATGYYLTITVPFLLAQGLGVDTTTELDAARTRVGVPDAAKIYIPRSNQSTANPTPSTAANTRGIDKDKIKGVRKILKRVIVILKDPIDAQYNGGLKPGWIKRASIRVPSAVSIAAIGTWLDRFPSENKKPKGFYREGSGNLYYPGDYTANLTQVDTSGR